MDRNEERYQAVLANVTSYLEARQEWSAQMRTIAQTKREMFQPDPVKPDEPRLSQFGLYNGGNLADALSLEPEYIIKLYLSLALKAEQSHRKNDGRSEYNEIANALLSMRSKFQEAVREFADPFSSYRTNADLTDKQKHIALDAIVDFFSNANDNQLNLSGPGLPKNIRHWQGEDTFFVFNSWSYQLMAGLVHEVGPVDPAQAWHALAVMNVSREGVQGLIHASHTDSDVYTRPSLRDIAEMISARSTPEAFVDGMQGMIDDILDSFVKHGDVHVILNDAVLAEKLSILSAASPFSYSWSSDDEYSTKKFLRGYRPEMADSPVIEEAYDRQLAQLATFYQEHGYVAQSSQFRHLQELIKGQQKNMLGSRERFAQIEAAKNPPSIAADEPEPLAAASRPGKRRGGSFLSKLGFGGRAPK